MQQVQNGVPVCRRRRYGIVNGKSGVADFKIADVEGPGQWSAGFLCRVDGRLGYLRKVPHPLRVAPQVDLRVVKNGGGDDSFRFEEGGEHVIQFDPRGKNESGVAGNQAGFAHGQPGNEIPLDILYFQSPGQSAVHRLQPLADGPLPERLILRQRHPQPSYKGKEGDQEDADLGKDERGFIDKLLHKRGRRQSTQGNQHSTFNGKRKPINGAPRRGYGTTQRKKRG